jgi:hypothetical protein
VAWHSSSQNEDGLAWMPNGCLKFIILSGWQKHSVAQKPFHAVLCMLGTWNRKLCATKCKWMRLEDGGFTPTFPFTLIIFASISFHVPVLLRSCHVL